MPVSIKRLGPGDEATLQLLARDDGDFDLDGRGSALEPLEPLDSAQAQRYLANPGVLHWVAADDSGVIDFLTREIALAPKKAASTLLSFG